MVRARRASAGVWSAACVALGLGLAPACAARRAPSGPPLFAPVAERIRVTFEVHRDDVPMGAQVLEMQTGERFELGVGDDGRAVLFVDATGGGYFVGIHYRGKQGEIQPSVVVQPGKPGHVDAALDDHALRFTVTVAPAATEPAGG